MRRSCSDSLLTANQMDGVFGSNKCNAAWQSGSWLGIQVKKSLDEEQLHAQEELHRGLKDRHVQ